MLHDMVDRSVGIYGTKPTAYLSALARMQRITRTDLDDAAEADHSLVRVRAMRYSVHLFPHDLLQVATSAMHELGRRPNAYRRLLEPDYPRLAERIVDALADGPLSTPDLRRRIDPDQKIGQHFSALLSMAASDCRIVRASAGPSSRADRYTWARWEDWLPHLEPLAIPEKEARHDLVRRYVDAYGPVTVDDLTWWTGWRKREAIEAADGIDLTRDGNATDLLDGVRLLPVWDVLMVAYKDRARLINEEHLRFAYDRLGNATSVVYDRGRIIGQWSLGRQADEIEIRVAPFGRWPSDRWDDVEAQCHLVAKALGAVPTLIRHDEPLNLSTASQNAFLAPLK